MSGQPITREKNGVIVANLGTPDGTSYWPMRRFLSEFLSDQRVVPLPKLLWQPLLQAVILTVRPSKSGKAYQSIWNHERNESPLLTITRDQTDALRARLADTYGSDVMVEFAMRYGNPSTDNVVQKMLDAGCTRFVFFPLYPQYSAATWATANDQLFRVMMDKMVQPPIRTIAPYYQNPAFINALKQSVLDGIGEDTPDMVVCSYHGLPESFEAKGDPYGAQCFETTLLLREALGWDGDKICTTFQSRFGAQEWLKPYSVTEVAKLAKAGKKHIAVLAPAFSADCIETLEEINEEIKDAFIEAGGERFSYIPCLNDRDDHMDALADIIKDNLAGWL